MRSDPTLIGTVKDVSGTTVSVLLLAETSTGLCFVGGESYKIGQVGSFVRIPLGFTSLFGIVSQVGAGAAPKTEDDSRPWGDQWLKVQLVGEGGRAGKFERGISQHPTINDLVHIVTEDDLRAIYGPGDPTDFVQVGHLASAESIPSLVDITKLVTRHSAVVGTTGAGKSTTVAGLLHALSDPSRYPSARIVVLDIHGEYGKALKQCAQVFRVNADITKGEKTLFVPFWALRFEELENLVFGSLGDKPSAIVSEIITSMKKDAATAMNLKGVTDREITVDSPIPFCIHKLWLDLHHKEYQTTIPKPGGSAEEVDIAYVLNDSGQPVERGDAMSLTPPQYRTVKTTGPSNERVQWGKDPLGIRMQLASCVSKLRDPRFSFMFNPGDWTPEPNGKVVKDLDILLQDWIGGPQPITILDLSGIPSSVLNDLVGALLRTLYDALFWARNLSEGGRERPMLLVLEEAHAYLGKDQGGPAAGAVKRIAKEGRKYGVGLMLVSQRPSEIDPTILSQCGTFFAMRLANDIDRGQVTSAASDNLKGLFDMLPVLRTGEAIIVGEAVSLPIRTLIDELPRDQRPDSGDPRVVDRMTYERDGTQGGPEGPGGWNRKREPQDYTYVVKQWRTQNPYYKHTNNNHESNSNEGAGT